MKKMNTADFDFHLPEELIAQTPLEKRDASKLLIVNRETAIIGSGAFVERVINRIKPNNIDEMLRGYYLERKAIFEYEEAKLITAKYAKKLRQNVNNLENYSLKEAANTLPYDMLDLIRRT